MKKITLIPIVFISSILIVYILYLLSDDLNHQNNSFVRLFPPHPVTFAKALDIKYNSFYISGATKDHIYLGNFTAPRFVLVANSTLTDTMLIKMKLGNEKIHNSVHVLVDSPYFYVMDGIIPAIFKGNVKDWSATKHNSTFFAKSVPISNSSFAIRSVSSNSHQNILGKELIIDTPRTQFVHNVLEKQVDGLFCTDGELHYSRNMASLIYIYFYRNQFIRMDTNLNILYKGKTIDTVSHTKIKVANISSEKSITLSSPPLFVNKRSSVSGKWLFVHSALLAKNESKKIFDHASVIDVYNLKDGVYQFSFYLHDFNGKKLRDFKVYNNLLIALFDEYIITYNLVPHWFQKEF